MTSVLERAEPSTDSPAPARLRAPLTRQRLLLRIVFADFAVATIRAWRYIDMSLGALFGGLGDMWNLLGRMTPPRFDNLDRAIELTFETLWMAVIGTALAVVLSVPPGFRCGPQHHTASGGDGSVPGHRCRHPRYSRPDLRRHLRTGGRHRRVARHPCARRSFDRHDRQAVR